MIEHLILLFDGDPDLYRIQLLGWVGSMSPGLFLMLRVCFDLMRSSMFKSEYLRLSKFSFLEIVLGDIQLIPNVMEMALDSCVERARPYSDPCTTKMKALFFGSVTYTADLFTPTFLRNAVNRVYCNATGKPYRSIRDNDQITYQRGKEF